MNEFQIQIPEKWMVGEGVTRGRQGKIWGGFMGTGGAGGGTRHTFRPFPCPSVRGESKAILYLCKIFFFFLNEKELLKNDMEVLICSVLTWLLPSMEWVSANVTERA